MIVRIEWATANVALLRPTRRARCWYCALRNVCRLRPAAFAASVNAARSHLFPCPVRPLFRLPALSVIAGADPRRQDVRDLRSGEARGSALLLAAAGDCGHPGRGDRVRRHADDEAPSDDGQRKRVRLFFVDGFFAYIIGVLARGRSLFGSFCTGQRPGKRPPASFGRPARPDHGARTLRSSPPPPWTFARRFGTMPWEGRCLCDGRSSDDEVLGTCLLGRVGCHQRSRSHGQRRSPRPGAVCGGRGRLR